MPELLALGGPGSGDFGHAGRPGMVGGSSSQGTREERQAMADYGYASMDLNDKLRTGRSTDVLNFGGGDKPSKGMVEHIDSLIAKQPPTTQDEIVYRLAPARVFEKLQPGDTITDKAFVSTTRDKSIAMDFADAIGEPTILMKIDMPKGTKALDMDKVLGRDNAFEGQKELVLPRNSTFRVQQRPINGVLFLELLKGHS